MSKKIGWQKYEDYIEKQLSCPMLQKIIRQVVQNEIEDELIDEVDDDDDDNDETYDEDRYSNISHLLPLTPQIVDDVSMLANFECWIGHCNFDITLDIKEKLNAIPGVEMLKIFSRYRFFIGIGQMFDFHQVRFDIEQELIKGESE